MPELTEQMYAHQQICIPPTFPYLLRQYAKAAIRTQPNDLLKWSTAYFRSLALGLHPPVKPRLEYPISKTHYGLTPGWLKTLLRQLQGNLTVSWPVLVDRWHGACLEVIGLAEIILTADFPDPSEIPWLKFVATASGFLTQNLTTTMILICELLTEEPEGGSAMINAGTFLELYKFLANLDASEPREVRNFYYTESNINLTKREPVNDDETSQQLSKSLLSEKEAVEEEEEKIPVLEEESIKDEKIEEENSPVLSKPDDIADRDDREPSIKEESSEETSGTSESIESEKSVGKEESAEDLGDVQSIKEAPSHTGETSSESTATSDEGYITMKLPEVLGIGPVVPAEMIDAVVKYVQELACKQQGMIMPRNIKHFLCPPLEEMDGCNCAW